MIQLHIIQSNYPYQLSLYAIKAVIYDIPRHGSNGIEDNLYNNRIDHD